MNMNDHNVNRRQFLSGLAAAAVVRPKARARRVIMLTMVGGPSQVDLFDPKPKLRLLDGKPLPPSMSQGERFAFIKGQPRLLASPFEFKRHGASGATLSTLLPNLAGVADRLTFVRSMHTTQFNHGPAQIFMTTGHQVMGRPSMGSWLSFALGSMRSDVPAFAVLLSGESTPDGGRACWSSGFLPTRHQGLQLRTQGPPVLFLDDPPGVSRAARRDSLDVLAALNRQALTRNEDPELVTRLAAYELGHRMQTSMPALADVSKEPSSIHRLYGTTSGRSSFGNNCLLARRLVERGSRFVQLFHRGWDTHGQNRTNDLQHRLPMLCQEVDRASAALVVDLERRGLLEDTLVVWGGEFGRTPMNEGRNGSPFFGRDHHRHAFTVWLAGAGIRPGLTLGETDDLGYRVVSDPVSVHDLHATILHTLGIDHTELTFLSQGRRYRLTDVAGQVVTKLLA